MADQNAAGSGCRIDRIDFHGWQAVKLSNGLVDLVAVPDVGGRIMAYDLGNFPYLWFDRNLAGKLFSDEENMGDGSIAAWKNYGGDKTWPAPQGWDRPDQWHGPPDPVLDTGRYTLEVVDSSDAAASIRMTSPPDPRTGVQIRRQITLHAGGGRVSLHLEMTNISDQERSWSIWDVVQVDATRRDASGQETHNDQAWLYIPTNPDSGFTRGYNVMFGEEDNPEWQREVRPNLLGAQYLYRLGKIGVDSTAGWIAFVNQESDYAFCQCFPYFPGDSYPDEGASVECWTTGHGEIVGGLDFGKLNLFHVEAEILGPLRRMAPGETQSLDLDWYVARCPGPIVNVTGAGCSHERLRADAVDAGIRLTGVFGLFHVGEVELVWLDGEDDEISAATLAPANPLDVLRVDCVRSAPPGAGAVQLRFRDPQGQTGALLDRCPIPTSLED